MAFLKWVGITCGFMGNILKYVCVTHCVLEYLGDFAVCSKDPSKKSKDVLLTEHITPRLQKLGRGDIVILRSPSNPQQNLCKRVAGMPGDKMWELTSTWTQYVPKGHVWLEEDSGISSDSHISGPVPMGLVRSKVICRIWPLVTLR